MPPYDYKSQGELLKEDIPVHLKIKEKMNSLSSDLYEQKTEKVMQCPLNSSSLGKFFVVIWLSLWLEWLE
jgi:hypothetical protein